MLVQPSRHSVSMLLREPEIPGARLLESPPDVWAINRAAALGNFPDRGLKVYVPAWSSMDKGDKVELLFNGDNVDQHTLSQDTEVGQRVTLWVKPKHWLTGPHTLAYRVTRLNQSPETFTPALKLYAKLEIPAGQDTDDTEGSHSNLHMVLDPPIPDGIVDKDMAKGGVRIIIRAESGTGAPYPDAAVGDVCICSWGGVYVESAPLTAEQINDPTNHPLEIIVDEATILEAGDTDDTGLAVTFWVRDLVYNYSEDWCKATRLVVITGTDLLVAPVVKETLNNVLDLDALGEKNITVEVWANGSEFKLDDRIFVKMRGKTVGNETVEITAPAQTVGNLPHTYAFTLPNADVRKLAKTQVIFSYHVERPGVVKPLRSIGQFVYFIGEPKRLAAPSAEDEQNGALDPDLPYPRVRIPLDPIMTPGMGIELIWFGVRSDTSTYTADLDWYILSKDEVEAGEDLVILVDGKHLKTLDGGTLDLSYNLLSEDQNGDIVRRESLHAALLRVGEPQFELVKPILLGEKDGALEPKDLPGGISKITCPNPTTNPTKAKDVVTWKLRDGNGVLLVEDFKELNSLSAGRAVDFSLNAAFVQQYFEARRGQQLRLNYQIWRAATDTTSYSNPLEFVVDEAIPALIVDQSQLVITGANLSIRDSGLDWERSGVDPAGTFADRTPTSGVPPYTYRSSDDMVASVDNTGRVRSEGNGTARVTVTDALERSASFEVVTTNVERIAYNPIPMRPEVSLQWVQSIGGSEMPRPLHPGVLRFIAPTPTDFWIGGAVGGNVWEYYTHAPGAWAVRQTNGVWQSQPTICIK